MALFALCLRLGFAHPDYLVDQLTLSQIRDWQAYMELEPVDDRRIDRYLQMLCYLTAHGGIPFETCEIYKYPKDPQDPKLIREKMRAALAAAKATATATAPQGKQIGKVDRQHARKGHGKRKRI